MRNVRPSVCPSVTHCRRKVRLSQKTARQRRQSHFSATVWKIWYRPWKLVQAAVFLYGPKHGWRWHRLGHSGCCTQEWSLYMRQCFNKSEWTFLQRVSIACYGGRCTSYSKSVRPSVCPSVTRWHSVNIWLMLRSWGLHAQQDNPMTTPWAIQKVPLLFLW